MRPSYSLDELLPHRPPMQLIDEVVDFDAETLSLTAAFTVRPEWSGNWVAIEYMAQAAAALVGMADRLNNDEQPSRPGFLLGTRRLTLDLPLFRVGRRYLVHATKVFADDEAGSFECAICTEEGACVASAVLNAFRPHNIASFMESQRA